MDLLMSSVLVLWMVLPLAVALTPPFVAATLRRFPWPAKLLYVLALTLVVRFLVELYADVDRADATGGGGSIFAGGPWMAAGVAAAAASVVVVVRSRRTVRA